MHHQRHHQKRRRNGKRRTKQRSSDSNTNTNSGDMDDVMAQLQLQRQRQKQKKKDADDAAIEERKGTKTSKRQHIASKEIGDFRFDPITNRYLPKSCFDKVDSNAIQKQREDACIDRLRWGKRNAIADEDLRRVFFRGTIFDSSCSLPNERVQKKKRKKLSSGDNLTCNTQQNGPRQQIPCSERIVQLLTTSLQYASSYKRHAIVNMLGPIAITRGAKVVPSAVSEDMLSNCTMIRRGAIRQPNPQQMQHQQASMKPQKSSLSEIARQPIPTSKSHTLMLPSNTLNPTWYSLLHPIIRANARSGCSQGIPCDEVCKTNFSPIATTFDIQPHSNSLPSVVTIADNALFCRQKCSIPSDGRKAFQLNTASHEDGSAWDLLLQDGATCQCVKFSPLDNYIGVLERDLGYHFVLRNFDANNSRTAPINRRYALDEDVNDFCFSPNDYSKVAFANGPESEYGLSYLDLNTGIEVRRQMKCKSEMFSVQFLGDQLLCGHRNGSISLYDTRGASHLVSKVSNVWNVGSVTSIQPLRNGNSVVVKGSFGSCHVVDVRKFENTNVGASDKATLFNLDVPASILHKTNSMRCTGIALDPEETVVISPFAGQNNLSFAMWCMKTGKFLRSIDLSAANSNTQLPKFCELSSRTTTGFAITQEGSMWPRITEESNFGIWFKSGPTNSAPPSYGGIHHLSFPK